MPTRKPPPFDPKPDNPTQYQRFLDMAKEVETDESPDAMDKVFEKLKPAITQAKPAPAKKPKP